QLSTLVRVAPEVAGASCPALTHTDVAATFLTDGVGPWLPVPTTEQRAEDLRVEFLCMDPDGADEELGLHLSESGQTRREGTVHYACHDIASANPRPVPVQRALSGNGYVVGGVVAFALDLTDRGGRPLSGFGVYPADSMLRPGVFNIEHEVEMLHTAQPGSS